MNICKALTPIFAVVAIALVECFAIAHGIDGTVLLISLCSIAGIAGYNMKSLISAIQNKDKTIIK
jgi:hypothetical protein